MSNGIVSISTNSRAQVNKLIYNRKDLIDAGYKGPFYFSYNEQDACPESPFDEQDANC
jgi:hypothetical protein